MKRTLLIGAAAIACLAAIPPLPAQAQPTPTPRAGTPPLTFQQQIQQQQQQQAAREARDRAQVERDLARMTPAAREEYLTYARERLDQAMAGQDLSRMSRTMLRDLERNGENLGQIVGGNDVFINDPARALTNQQFGQDGARGGVQAVNGLVQTSRDVLRTVRPLVLELGRASADIMVERQRALLASNPNMSPADRDRLRAETTSGVNGGNNIGLRLDESDMRMRETQRVVRESEDRIAREMERMANEQGQDPTQWHPSPPARTTVRPRPLPAVQPASAPPAPNAAPPPPTQVAQAGGGRRPVQRGTIPNQNSDPYEGLRVPQNQGGTGANPTPSPNPQQTAAERQRQQQAQAEANAARTERNRQSAQDRSDIENAQADEIFGSAERERQAQAAREYEDMLENLRNQSRPGNVGRGGGGATGGGSYGDQIAGGSGFPDGGYSATEELGYGSIEDGDEGQYSPTEAFLFEDGGSFQSEPDAWQSFEMGGTITVAELVPIYDGYDWWNAPIGSSGRSLSSAGSMTPSSAGSMTPSSGGSIAPSLAGSMTPSSAPTGMRVDWDGYNLSADPFRVSNGGRPEPGSYADMLAQIYGPRQSLLPTNPWTDDPWATSNADLARALYGPLWSDRPYQLRPDPYGDLGRGYGGAEVANLFDTDLDSYLRLLGSDFDYLRRLLASDRGGLDRALAQPFNVLLTWGANAFDLDLHMTGPLPATTDRFHIFYAAAGQLDAAPFAQLIKDCICNSGSEVILTSALTRNGGVYRVSVFNFGDQSASSTNLANQSQATLQIVRGGTAVSVGNGTTIDGGVTLLTVGVPQAQPGNTWVAAEINPNNGTITTPGVIVQSQGSGNVD